MIWPSKQFQRRMWSDIRKARRLRGQMITNKDRFSFFVLEKDLLNGLPREFSLASPDQPKHKTQ